MYNSDVQRHDVVIHGKNGHSDTVTGVTPESGETVPQLIHRIYPDLSPDQLHKETAQFVKYNRDYGNNITADSRLDSCKPVYLPSIETTDSDGRVNRIQSPNGNTTEIAYDGDKVSGYRIMDNSGRIVESVSSTSNGQYDLVNSDGKQMVLKNVAVDGSGNITLTDEQGDKIGHLTRGDDVYTQFQSGKPACATVVRNGQIDSTYQYDYSDNQASVYATYADRPSERMLLNQQDNQESILRLSEGRGDDVASANPHSGAVSTTGDDVLPDQFGTRLLQKLNLPVTAANLTFLSAWQQAEGGSADNPFNTTEDAPGATDFNSVGVKRYPSVAEGLDATAETLTNGYYGGILTALKEGNDPMAAARALAASPWGTGSLVEQVLAA
jgi:hypothetical protein